MRQAVEAFLRHLTDERNASPHTCRAYAQDLAQFQGHAEVELGRAPRPKDVDHLLIRSFLARLHRQGLKKVSAARKLATLRTFFRYLRREGVLKQNPAEALLSPRLERVNGDAVARDRVAQEWIELQALRYTNYRALGTLQRTGIPGPEGSAIKLRWSEQNQRLTKLGRELLGPEGILDDGWWHHQQLRSRGNTIEAGSSEVLRNIVAERVLGLPKSR